MTTDSHYFATPKPKEHWHHLPLLRRILLAIRKRELRKQQRLQTIAMKNLSDHLLNDIGLTREDALRISDTGSNARTVKEVSMARLVQSRNLNNLVNRS